MPDELNDSIQVFNDFIQYLNSESQKYEISDDYHYRYSNEILNFWQYCENNNIFLPYKGKEERIYLISKSVDTMNLEEIRKNLDVIFYGERLASGNIMHNINNGRLIELLKRVIILVNL